MMAASGGQGSWRQELRRPCCHCAGLTLLVTRLLDPGFSHIWLKARVHMGPCWDIGNQHVLGKTHLPMPRPQTELRSQPRRAESAIVAGALAELLGHTANPS